MESDADLLGDFENDLFARHPETTAKTYRTGPRSFARWLGHEDQCSNSQPNGFRTKLQYCMSDEGDASSCTNLLLEGLTQSNIHDFVRDKKLDDYGHTTIRSYYYGLKEFADYAETNGLLQHQNPFNAEASGRDALDRYNISQTNTKKQGVDVSKYWDDKRVSDLDVVAFPASVVREIIDAAPAEGSQHRNSLLLKFLWQTGVRAVEASTLEWRDFDGVDSTTLEWKNSENDDRAVRIRTAKQHSDGDNYRYLSYRDNLDTLLRVWKEEQPALTYPETEYVFSTEQSAQMSPNRINQIVRAAADAAGYSGSYATKGGKRHEFSAHVFRSSYATHCANFIPEIDIDDVRYLLGHNSLSESQKYILPNIEAHVKASRHGPR